MKYENELACGGVATDMMPQEDLTNMLCETRAMTQEARKLAGIIGEHLFGNKNEANCCSEEKCAEPVNFKETLINTRRTVKETIEVLANLRAMIGA